MADYSFLKSGFNTLIEKDRETACPDELILRVKSILFSFMEKGIKQAEVYIEHSGRNNITKEDLKICLQAETFDYLSRPDILDSVQKWRRIILEDDDDGDEEEGEDVEEDVEEEDEPVEPEPEHISTDESKLDVFLKSTCKCELCEKLNNIDTVWNAWTPQEGIETILYNAINTQF